MNTSDLTIPDYYVVQKTDGSGKEQIVKYYQKVEGEREGVETMYYGYYGINSYHEVVSQKKNIRELTQEERKLFSEKKYWHLPQDFYHSFPQY
jgi:hypothetical protein